MVRKNKTNGVNFNNFNDKQKVNYVKNLLFNRDLTSALDMLLKEEKKDLTIIKTIIKVLDEDLIINRIKQQCNIKSSARTFVYSKIISILAFYNMQSILDSFLAYLDSETLKKVAFYEYQNRTLVSISSEVFKKYCFQYKEEAKKSLVMSNEDMLMLTTGMDNYNFVYKKGNKNFGFIKYICALLFIVLFIFMGVQVNKVNQEIKKFDGLVFEGTYLNDINLSKSNYKDLETVIAAEKEKIENGTIVIKNPNGTYTYTYKEVGIEVEYENVLEDIKKYNDNLNWLSKAKIVHNKKRYKTFYLESKFTDAAIDNFIKSLEQKLNTEVVQDGLKVGDNYTIYYDKGKNGFKLNVQKTTDDLKNELASIKDKIEIEAVGEVVKMEAKNTHLASIDKMVSSYTTYFNNVGNRGQNIVLATTRLNGTILMPGDTFSYLKAVGPYSYANGYRPAPAYVNGAVASANGGGVCQLASTLYNAQLRAGLDTVYRTYHIFAPDYVPKGLDATVYSTTVDYKFKNQYNYPVYISAYVKGNYLTVDLWTSKDALGNKTYEPYAVYSNGGYNSYLKEFENGVYVKQKYLSRSVYKSH